MKDDYCTGCRNVSHCQQQQSYSGLCSPGRSYSNYLWNDSWILICNIRSEKELEPKCLPQLFLGSLLVTRRSAIGQFFFLSLVTVPEVFAWVNSARFLLVSKVANVSLFLPVCCFHKWRSRGRWDRVCPWVPSYGRCGRTPITHLKLISTEIEVKQLPYSHGSSLRDVCYKSIPFSRVSVRLYSKVDVKVWY